MNFGASFLNMLINSKNTNAPLLDNQLPSLNGVIDAAQLSGEQKTKFSIFAKYFDADGDAKFNQSELKNLSNAVSVFSQSNPNADGTVAKNTEEMTAMLQMFDVNGDGKLDAAEMSLLNTAGQSGLLQGMVYQMRMQNLMPSNITYSKGSTYANNASRSYGNWSANRKPYKPQPSTKEQLGKLEEQIKAKETEIEKTKTDNQKAEADKENEINKTLTEKTKISDELKQQKDANNKAIQENSQKILQTENKISQKEASISSLGAKISGLRAQKAAIPEGTDTASKAANAAKKAEIESEIQALTKQKEAEEKELEQLKKDKAELEKTKQKLETEKTQLENKILEANQELKTEVDKLKEELNTLKTDGKTALGALEKELSELRTQRVEKSEKQGKIEAGSLEFDRDFTENMTESQKRDLEQFKQHYLENKERYEAVAEKTGKPAKLIAALHWRESNGNFKTYMHNGDPLGRPTVNVPRGKFFNDWESSAIDALNEKNGCGLSSDSQDTGAMLEFAERYNGLGYRNKGVSSPYVWAGTDQYQGGKYVADGVYNPNHRDNQLGVALMLKSLNFV